MQFLLFYGFVAWMPAILQSKGVSPDTAGCFAPLCQWIGNLAPFAVSLLTGKMKD